MITYFLITYSRNLYYTRFESLFQKAQQKKSLVIQLRKKFFCPFFFWKAVKRKNIFLVDNKKEEGFLKTKKGKRFFFFQRRFCWKVSTVEKQKEWKSTQFAKLSNINHRQEDSICAGTNDKKSFFKTRILFSRRCKIEKKKKGKSFVCFSSTISMRLNKHGPKLTKELLIQLRNFFSCAERKVFLPFFFIVCFPVLSNLWSFYTRLSSQSFCKKDLKAFIIQRYIQLNHLQEYDSKN